MKFYRKASRFISIVIVLCMAAICFDAGAVSSYAAASAASAKRPQYIAHRGLSAKAPENTLAAFKLAADDSNFYGVEFDIWESSAEPAVRTETETFIDEDGNEQVRTREVPNDPLILVMHNSSIKRMCGVKKKIRTISRSDLDSYTIISGKRVSLYSGQKIPTVEQTLDTIWSGSGNAVPVIELKHRFSERGLKYLITLLGDRKAVIISFNFNAVADAARMARSMGIRNNIQTMYLMDKLPKKKYSSTIRKMKKADIDCLSLDYTKLKKTTVKRFHKAGLKVCVWTLPSRKKARKCARMGVDYITANGAIY